MEPPLDIPQREYHSVKNSQSLGELLAEAKRMGPSTWGPPYTPTPSKLVDPDFAEKLELALDTAQLVSLWRTQR